MKLFLAGLLLVLAPAVLRVITMVWLALLYIGGKHEHRSTGCGESDLGAGELAAQTANSRGRLKPGFYQSGANMQRQAVNSTRIKSVGFQDGTLEIEFHGSGRVYQYTGAKVKDHYDGLMKANRSGESVGRYFNDNVRHCSETKYCEIKEPQREG